MKYLGINLIKYMQDLNVENYKTLMKDIKKDLKNVEIFHVCGQEDSIPCCKNVSSSQT